MVTRKPTSTQDRHPHQPYLQHCVTLRCQGRLLFWVNPHPLNKAVSRCHPVIQTTNWHQTRQEKETNSLTCSIALPSGARAASSSGSRSSARSQQHTCSTQHSTAQHSTAQQTVRPQHYLHDLVPNTGTVLYFPACNSSVRVCIKAEATYALPPWIKCHSTASKHPHTQTHIYITMLLAPPPLKPSH